MPGEQSNIGRPADDAESRAPGNVEGGNTIAAKVAAAADRGGKKEGKVTKDSKKVHRHT